MSESTVVSEDALKLLVAEHGVRGTARLLQMDDRQTDAFRQRVTRGKWLADPAIVALRARSSVASPSAPGQRPLPVVANLSPTQANAAELQALGYQTRLSLAKGIAKAGAHVESLSGPEILDRSGDVKSIAQTADLVHGWKDSAPNVKIRLDVLNAPSEQPVFDVEAEVSASESWDNELDDY